MKRQIPNFPHTVDLPANLESEAAQFTLTAGELVWLLVADFMARCGKVRCIEAADGTRFMRRPAQNIIPFPGREETT